MRGFFVTGTDTAVGKTEVAAYLARMFRRKSFRVGVMKPIATGVGPRPCEDAEVLKKSSHSKDPAHFINPVSLRLPLAPLVCSLIEKKQIDMRIIWKGFKRLTASNDIVIVEGIGGVMVPIYRRGRKIFYVLDMISRMRLPVIIVARPGLGTINHTLMTIRTLKANNLRIAGIIFNYTSRIKKDISIETNPGIIEALSGVKVLGIMSYHRKRERRRVKWLNTIGC